MGHKPTWSLLACFQVLPGWNSPKGHVIELPRPNQNLTSAPQDPPILGVLSTLPSARLLPEEHQRPLQGPGDNGTEILSEAPGGLAGMEPGITGNRNGGVGPPVLGER